MAKPTGYTIYRGPSMLDGAPIVAIAILGSSNRKTGDMVQTYIIRADVKPTEAARSGADASVCGDCKHRPFNGGACYVVLAQGPTVVFKGHAAGKYPDADPSTVAEMIKGRMVRLGTYGDPAAVPRAIWDNLIRHASGHTGYTHQWARTDLRDLCMASADSAEERDTARSMGWRTFRVMLAGSTLGAREFECPASEEQGKRKTCATCGACNGAKRVGQASVAIVVHGGKARRFDERKGA